MGVDPASGDLEEAQYQEVLRRLRDIETGEDELKEWEQVHAELLVRIARRVS
ncbi:hypothetical protein [Nannocystis radixulma]|uniref:Uncharacterized protein n=1 Tax=Nannocystis radixulma TaxID=2995305 RepID=A0ABT5BP24_9BACT|nr:hypothetical protein [Nannocystis radixulma]MDC0674737.1 hypothetical protein [Nannocystis radixulma]